MLAQSIVPYCRCGIAYDENLRLKGLRLIYLRNSERAK